MSLQTTYTQLTIQQLVNHFEKNQLNLEPAFQRQSVWSNKDRVALIESIFENIPIPSLFFYKNKDSRGDLVYDVIDGKQRLEAILAFMRQGKFRKGEKLAARIRIHSADDRREACDWNKTRKLQQHSRFLDYKIQTVEVSGELHDIIRVFLKINSTGKKLTSAEKRHAHYLNTDFLKLAQRIADRYLGYFKRSRILSPGAISRMKHVELTSELLASLMKRCIINKKKALDEVIGGSVGAGTKLKQAGQECIRVLNLLEKMFPRLKETRFANAADFYSLFMLVWQLDQEQCVLNNLARNRQAEKLLIWLSQGVDEVRQQHDRFQAPNPEQRIFADYLMTVKGDTDSSSTRERRAKILSGLMAGLFEKKDERRLFSREQRRLIWHSESIKRCSHPDCGVELDWANFTIDHIKPFSKGGKTSASNAALMCKKHNSSKGARAI